MKRQFHPSVFMIVVGTVMVGAAPPAHVVVDNQLCKLIADVEAIIECVMR